MPFEEDEVDRLAPSDSSVGGSERQTAVDIREVSLPRDALQLSTLSRVDYTDACRLETAHARERTGEEWARALLEEAPAATRTSLRRGWFVLGVRLGSTENERLVLGWSIRRSSPEFALLAARSLLGMDAEVLVKRDKRALLVATIMQFKNPLVRAFWAAFSHHHRRVVLHLVKEAGRRAETSAGRGAAPERSRLR
jgi:hypothetical protein